MTEAVIVAALVAVAVMATAVVFTRDPAHQAIVLSAYGITLGIFFVVLQAPDVAMSQIAVGTVIVPLVVILAIHAIRRNGKADR